jgi:hypothetical protein
MRLRSLPLLILLLNGCSSTQLAAPRTWLDERTAVTVTAQSDPAVLAREEHMRAINVRDYAQLGAVEANRMGTHQLYLVLVSWSTIDRSATEQERSAAGFSRITLYADDRPIELTRAAPAREELGFARRPFAHPTPGAHEIYFAVTRGHLQSIALSGTLQLIAHREGGAADKYLEWRDGRPGLRAFLASSVSD